MFVNNNQKPNKPIPVKKKREELKEETVSNINFFQEDLVALDEEVEEADKLYDEIHSLYTNLTGGEYVPNKNLRDIAEIAKTMVSTRSYHADAINKRIALKKLIVDVNYRNNGGLDENGNEAIQATARQIVAMVKQETLGKPSTVKPKQKQSQKEVDLLEKNIKSKLDSGELVMGVNDNLVGTSEYVVSRYDKDKEKFVAVDSRNGEVIENFPEDRLPSGKINKVSDDSVTLFNGDEIKVYNNMEFDDEYLDEGD